MKGDEQLSSEHPTYTSLSGVAHFSVNFCLFLFETLPAVHCGVGAKEGWATDRCDAGESQARVVDVTKSILHAATIILCQLAVFWAAVFDDDGDDGDWQWVTVFH